MVDLTGEGFVSIIQVENQTPVSMIAYCMRSAYSICLQFAQFFWRQRCKYAKTHYVLKQLKMIFD